MNPLRLNRKMISGLFWDLMDAQTLPEYALPAADHFDRLRASADYDTGSLNEWDMVDLIAICAYFKPKFIAEVGTFVGRSTYALAVGSGPGALIYTCDASNDIPLPEMPESAAEVVRHPRESSTQMFNQMLAMGSHDNDVDLFFIDGRVSEADRLLMEKLSHQKTVIVLDDFEGIEKGVDNAKLLGTSEHLLIYPRPEGKTALLVPIQLLQLTAQ